MLLAALGLGAWLVLRPTPHARLLVGVDDDTLKWTADPLAVVRWQRSIDVDAVRVWVPWAGEARPQGARVTELARAEAAARQTRVVLAVFGFARSTPATARARARFCGYARAVRNAVPDARAIVVWNEANSPAYWRGTPAQYEALLARCYDELHRKGLTVLDSTASAHAPDAFLEAVGAAYRASGRTRPLVDGFGHNPYPASPGEWPDAVHRAGFVGEGDYPRLVALLRRAFGRTPQIWYLEDGYQSAVPATLERRYSGLEDVPTVTAAEQSQLLAEAIDLAGCQRDVRAFFNFELVDETRLAGWQSGLFWRGVRRKPAVAAFEHAVRRAGRHCT
ncbi:MAG TPA: hypothetical protein VFA24_05495 [Gaiellaceae bacterium]|nr:hypothetical protein [Gaiellaceae bacterium]